MLKVSNTTQNLTNINYKVIKVNKSNLTKSISSNRKSNMEKNVSYLKNSHNNVVVKVS